MSFRIKLCLLIFSFMFSGIALAVCRNFGGGGFIYPSPGDVFPLSSTVYCSEGALWDKEDLWWSGSGLNCAGTYEKLDQFTYSLRGGLVEVSPEPGAASGLHLIFPQDRPGHQTPPPWYVIVRPRQIPDECADAGDPVNAIDGTFNLESIDLSSGNPGSVSLIRSYKSRERNIYFNDNPGYKNLLLPFSEGGWTHNYVKSIKMEDVDGDIYYKIRDGNEIRDVMLVKESGYDSINFANIYKVHRGLVEVDSNHWEYTKSDGTIEFYSRSNVCLQNALIDSIEQFGEITLRFGYDDSDTLEYVADKWGDSLKFYYKVYDDIYYKIIYDGEEQDTIERHVYISLLDKVEISGKEEWMEYKYIKFNSIYGINTVPFRRLSQVIKHTSKDSLEDELIVLDRYYYNRDFDPEADSALDLKSDIVTHIFPQGSYDEDNDTTLTAYNNHRLSGYRVNNWYGKYGNEGVYYQEVVSGDTILEKTYIDRFYLDDYDDHRVDSIYIYHWEDLRELGAHDPNNTEFTPTTSGYDYLEIIRYNIIGMRTSATVAGKTTTYLSYDSDYNPLLIQKPNGDTIRYEYYQYTVNGETRNSSYPTKIVYPGGDSVLNYYSRPDTTNNPYFIRLEESVDEIGRSTVYTYDANNYTDEITLDDRYVAGEGVTDVVTDYDYNAVGNLLQVTDPEGTVTYYEYSDNDNGPFLLKSGVDVGGDGIQSNDILTFYSYNNIGEIETKIEARVNPTIMDTTEYEYDCLGKLSKIIHPNGDYEEFTYDKTGNLTQKKSLDTLGISTVTHNYKSYPSGKLREVEENEGAGYTTKYDYNQDGKLIEFSNALDKDINYNYNQNKLVSTHYADGTKDSLGYYPCGCLLQFKEDRNGEVTEYVYDERARIKKKLYYDDISDYNGGFASDSLVYKYNKAGEIIKTKDKNGDIFYSRDDVGNLDTVKVYSLYENVYQYDLSGRKTHFKSYKSGTPSQVYLEQSFQYDDAGRDTSTTANGKTWNLSYYDNNALKKIKYPEIPGDTIRLTESYTIGSIGEITEISVSLDSSFVDSNLLENPGFEEGDMSNWQGYSANGETVWYVDSLEEILEFSCGDTTGGGTVSHSWQVNNSDPKEGTYSLYSPYNPPQSYADVEFAIQRFEISDYSGPFEASCWVKTNELEGGIWIGVLFWIDYTDSIRVLTHQYTDKITGTNDWTQLSVTVEDSSYDVSNFDGIFYIERMRDTGEVWVDEAVCIQIGDSTQVPAEYKITYEYDQRANRDYASIKLPDGTKEEQIYRYDNINRLKRTIYQDSGGPPSLQYEYTYDPVGNRTVKVETDFESPDTSQYTYNYNTNNNRLTGITETGETYTYNDRGDLLTATGGYTFSYDREGRLEEIIEAIGEDTNKFEFSYTSEGRRFRKIHFVDTSGVVTADTTYYVYDGMYAIAELNGSLDLRSKYVYTNGMLVGRIDSSGEFFQYFHDGLGSITMIVDSTGSYQNLYTYDDFGDFRHKSENVSNSYYYTGQERDEEPSGLYNLRARYYAAGIGRFTQEDPVDYAFDRPQRMNLYTYVMNNPVNRIDPLGLICYPITASLPCGPWKKVSESVNEDVPWLFVPGASSYEGPDEVFGLSFIITCVWYRELPVQEKFIRERQRLLACMGRCGFSIKKETSFDTKSRNILRRQTRQYTAVLHTDVIFEIEVCKSLPELHP